MKETVLLHYVICEIISKGVGDDESSSNITFKVLNEVQEIIGSDIKGYIGNIEIIKATLKESK